MANFLQEDVLVLNDDYEYNLGEDGLLGPHGQEEPMDLYDGILDQEESADPAEEEPNMFGCGGNDIFEQDSSVPSPQPSSYRMLQLIADVNAPTPEENPRDFPPCSPTTEAVLQPSDLVWTDEV